MTKPPITVGIPVFNEQEILVTNVERLLAFLDQLGCEYEVLIGSNGSTDATVSLGHDLARRFARVKFFHIPERGVGRAFRGFVERARYPYLISQDMDLSVDLAFISTAVELLARYDIVVGSKKLGIQKRSRFRRLGSDSFLFAVRCLFSLPYDDYSIAAKAFRIDLLRERDLRVVNGSAYVLEVCHWAAREGRLIVQVPVRCEDWRHSKFNLLAEAGHKWSHLLTLWLRSRVVRPLGPSLAGYQETSPVDSDETGRSGRVLAGDATVVSSHVVPGVTVDVPPFERR